MAHMQATRQIKEIIGENIRSRRDELKISRRELGARIGADQTLIFKWETGRHRPQDDTLALLAQKLDRDLVWFFTDHSSDAKAAA